VSVDGVVVARALLAVSAHRADATGDSVHPPSRYDFGVTRIDDATGGVMVGCLQMLCCWSIVRVDVLGCFLVRIALVWWY